MHNPTDRITHTTTFVTPVVEHWLEREIAQWVHPMKDRSDDPSHHERTLYLWAYECSSCNQKKKWKTNNTYNFHTITSFNNTCSDCKMMPCVLRTLHLYYWTALNIEGNVSFLKARVTKFIYINTEGRKEGRNVLFNDALNTFYLWLYGRKEMFYLMTHSTHFNGYTEGRNVLFNNTLNTFYLWLYGRKECFI